MHARIFVPAVGLCLLLGSRWAWAQPGAAGLVRPNSSPTPLPYLPGQFVPTPPPATVPTGGDLVRPVGPAQSAALPTGLMATPPRAVAAPTDPALAAAPGPNVVRLTLDDVKQRVLADNNLLQLAAHNVQSKGYATRAAESLYFPQIIGQSVYLHFNDFLGTVLTTQGRTVQGPRGVPLVTFPSTARDVAVVNQDTALNNLAVVQPLTDLLKVRQGVKIARADEQIAQAQLEKGTRELLSGVEQLYWGLLTVQRIRAGAEAAVAGTEPLAKTGNLEARTALVEGKQALQAVSDQVADLQEQLAILLNLPACTQFDLVEPPLPLAPVRCADEAVGLALASSPEIREAEQTVAKARAAVSAAKLDYVPSIAVLGGYANQTAADYIQPNIGYVGVMGTYTFVDWGKRKSTIRERDEFVAMATLKVRQTQDTVRQNALKAFREYEQSQEAYKLAGELVAVRTEAEKAAATLDAKFKAAKDAMTAQVDYLKAGLAHRVAYVKLMAIIGRQ
jgi:outer membrane protein TolC